MKKKLKITTKNEHAFVALTDCSVPSSDQVVCNDQDVHPCLLSYYAAQ